MERVVITGMGAVSALGLGVEKNFQQAVAGISGIAQLDAKLAIHLSCGVAAQIKFPLPELLKKSEAPLFDRFSVLAWIAANEALVQSGLPPDTDPSNDSGVFWGTATGGTHTLEAGYVDLFVNNKNRLRPLTVVSAMNNAAAGQIAMRAGFRGTVNTYSTACVSSAQAIGEAFRHIRHGYAKRIIAGGSEASLTRGSLAAWDALRVLASTDAEHPERSCRPFSKNRTGLVLGEGGAALVLESLSSARARGATILAELVGYGTSNDAVHMTKPDPHGQARAMQAALINARLLPSDIGYINAHGAGTLTGDVAETESIKQVFCTQANSLIVSSTKGVHGHTLGAAGALEFVLSISALRSGTIPPTAFLDQRDPACDLDMVPMQSRTISSLDAVMSNSFAFGGSNVALIGRRFSSD